MIPVEVSCQGKEPSWHRHRHSLGPKSSSVLSAGVRGVSLVEGAVEEDLCFNHIGHATGESEQNTWGNGVPGLLNLAT